MFYTRLASGNTNEGVTVTGAGADALALAVLSGTDHRTLRRGLCREPEVDVL